MRGMTGPLPAAGSELLFQERGQKGHAYVRDGGMGIPSCDGLGRGDGDGPEGRGGGDGRDRTSNSVRCKSKSATCDAKCKINDITIQWMVP